MDDNDLNGLFTRDLEALEMTIHSPMSAFIEMTMEGRGLPVSFSVFDQVEHRVVYYGSDVSNHIPIANAIHQTTLTLHDN